MRCLAFALLCAGLTAGCADYPRDSAGTLNHVRKAQFTVGVARPQSADPRLQALVAELGARAASKPRFVQGESEALLASLEQGEIDLITGVFDKRSPWSKRVTFSKVLAPIGDGSLELKAAVRNGEHAWSMAVDRAVKAVRQRSGA